MRKWIEFNLKYPKIILLILVLVTIIASLGLTRLEFDTSTDEVFPKSDISYKVIQRAREVFGDSKTFMTAVIEPTKSGKLLSRETFAYCNSIIEEMEEFKHFNNDLENRRLNLLMEIGNVTAKEGVAEIADSSQSPGHNSPSEADPAEENDDFWSLEKPIRMDFYATATRARRTYDYTNYQPVAIQDIRGKLDPVARRQLNTILHQAELKDYDDRKELSEADFREILERWETAYLYKSMEVIKQFANPISGEDIQGADDQLIPVKLVPVDESGKRILPEAKEDFRQYRENLEQNPAFENVLYSRNSSGDIQAIAINMQLRPIQDDGEIFTYFYDMFTKYNEGPVEITPLGFPIYRKFVRDYMEVDLYKLLPLVILVVILTFYLNFRSLRGVIFPTISVVLGTVWTMGILGYAGIPVTMVVNMLPPLLIAVGSSYSIHIYNQYLHDQESIRQYGKRRGLKRGMLHISSTVLLAALTTFIGFMILSVNDVPSLRDFGIFAGLGSMISMAVSIMLIPSALVLMKLIPVARVVKSGSGFHRNIIVNKIIQFFATITLRHSRKTVAVAAIIVAVFTYGITQIEAETSHMHYFNEESYLYRSEMKFGELFNGSVVLSLIIDSGTAGGVKEPRFLTFVEELRQWITSSENRKSCHLLHTSSFGDVLKRMHMAMNNGSKAFYTIPDSRETIEEYMEIFSGDDEDFDGRVDEMEVFIDPDFRYSHLMIRMGPVNGDPFTQKDCERAEKYINAHLAKHPMASEISWKITGEPKSYNILAKHIIKGLLKSIIFTILVVALVIFLLFRNWRAALLAILPITTCIILVYGFMGFFGISLDISKAILAAIAIGIGVDDTIHMMKTLRYHLRRGLPLNEAMAAAFKEAGMAIVYTSVALVFGFSMFLLSSFVPIFYFGWLVASTMIATTIAALVLLPSVIICFKLDLVSELDWKVLHWLNLSRIFDLDEKPEDIEMEEMEEEKIA